MEKKQILFDEEGRRRLANGINKLARAVEVTLGPGGRNVVIEKSFGKASVTKDGVSVSKEVELGHPFENLGAKLVNEVATKTNKEVGDGTTTSVVLTKALIHEGMRYVTSGVSPVALRNGMDKALERAVQALGELAQPVKGKQSIQNVAHMASNGDVEVSEMLAEAMTKVGVGGVVKVEENDGVDSVLDYVDGLEFDKGFLSPYFVTDAVAQEAVLEKPYVLVTDHKISGLHDLVPLLEQIVPKQRPLFIVAEDVEGEALAGLILNNLRGVLPAAAIKAPAFGDRRKAMLEDLSVFTGGTFLSKDTGFDWGSVKLSDLGSCAKIEIDKDTTQFFRGAGKKSSVDARIQQIDAQIEQSSSTYDREKLEERRAKLGGKIALIKVGAHTELEIKERKDRADDALNATRAAMEEGIVPGSGTAYLRVEDYVAATKAPGDEALGVQVVRRALRAPMTQLGDNAGFDGPALVAEVEDMKGNQGYDVVGDEAVDLFKAGIVDPLKVVRVALQNAVSIASLNLIADTLITDIPKEQEAVEGAVI